MQNNNSQILKAVGMAAPPKRVVDLVFFVDVSTSTAEPINSESTRTKREALEAAVAGISDASRELLVELPAHAGVNIQWYAFNSEVSDINSGSAGAPPVLPTIEGGTSFSAVLAKVEEVHAMNPGRLRKVFVVISDGEPTLGDTNPTTLALKAGELRATTRATLVGLHVGSAAGYDVLAALVADPNLIFRVGAEDQLVRKLQAIVLGCIRSSVTGVGAAEAIAAAMSA